LLKSKKVINKNFMYNLEILFKIYIFYIWIYFAKIFQINKVSNGIFYIKNIETKILIKNLLCIEFNFEDFMPCSYLHKY